MASSPGHPFWDVVIAEMIERAPILDRGWGMHHLKEGDWVSNVLWRTGHISTMMPSLPDVYAQGMQCYTPFSSPRSLIPPHSDLLSSAAGRIM